MHSLKVLILEDHPFQLMALHQMLNANGVFDVLAAESVECAKQMLARRGPVDIAICDLYMEGADGLALIRHLAENALADALIVLSDAEPALLDSIGELSRQLGLQLLGCVRKPASCATLHRLLSQYCDATYAPQQMAVAPHILELTRLSPEQLALSRAQWRVRYQPMICAAGALIGVEASVRWQHPTLGLLAPGQFFTVPNGVGLLDVLTWHVLEHALAFSSVTCLGGGQPLPVTVELPPALLPDARFVARLAQLLVTLELPASVLTLTLKEGHCGLLDGEQWAVLRQLGCRLALECSGSAAGNLPQLFALPLSELKLPADLLRGLAADGKKSGAVATALILARRLALDVVVQGVETFNDWRALNHVGKPRVQGGFVARPMGEDELLKWMNAHEPAALARNGAA